MIERYHIKHINSEVERLLGAPQVALKGDQYMIDKVTLDPCIFVQAGHENDYSRPRSNGYVSQEDMVSA